MKSSAKNPTISAYLTERINAKDFPSAVYLIGEAGEIKFADALGLAVRTPKHQIPAKLDTIYDLASLTKVLVTGLLCAKLIEQNELRLNDQISRFFPGFDTIEKRFLTVRDLLTHVSGFAAWKPFYFLLQNLRANASAEDLAANPKAEALAAIQLEDLETAPRTIVRYSDFNFIALGFLLEKLSGKPLTEIARTEIFDVLKLKRTRFNPVAAREKIAACEFGSEYEKQMCRQMNYDVDNFKWRDELIWSQVHDNNCFALGGATGHAGLFSTAAEVFEIAKQFLPAHTVLLRAETCTLFRTNLTKNLNAARSLAFELAASADSTASRALAPDSFGHLGFTGTSLWIEPDSERVFILLTNRTHRALPFININGVRRRFHELAAAALN